MSRRAGSSFSRFRPQAAVATEEAAAARVVVKRGPVTTDQADAIISLLHSLGSNLGKLQERESVALVGAPPVGLSGAPADSTHTQVQPRTLQDAAALLEGSARLPAPKTLSEHLQKLILQGVGPQFQGGKPLPPGLCKKILDVCSTMLPSLLRYQPADFNKYEPGMADHFDHSVSVTRSYLQNVAAALTLVTHSISVQDARQLKAILERVHDKVQDLDRNSGPPNAAARPGKQLALALGTQMPDHPMSAPLE